MFHFARVSLLVFALSLILQSANGQDNPMSSEALLPTSTRAWFSIPDWSKLTDNFKETGIGKLSELPAMKPFADSLSKQVDDYLDQRNFRLGLTIDDIRNLRSGEICFAGVLPVEPGLDGRAARGSHGIVMLVNVSGREEQAKELLDKVSKELLAREAVLEPLDPIQGVEVQRFRLPLKNPAIVRHTLHAIADGWLLASDNEGIFRELVRRLKNPEQAKVLGCLRDDPAFQAVRQNSGIEETTADFRWFIEPFGYVQLAQAIADENIPIVQKKNDHAAKLQRQGFDVFQAVGGEVALNQMDHDLVHRAYLHAPLSDPATPERERCLKLVNLDNAAGLELTPEAFVPSGSNSYLTLSWNMKAALDNVGPIVDDFVEPGMFERTLNSWHTDMGVDVRQLISSMGNRVTIISSTLHPIDVGSERMAFAVPVNGEEDDIYNAIAKLQGSDAVEVKRDGFKFLLIESRKVEDVPELKLDDPDFLDDDPDNFDQIADEDTFEAFNLFEKRLITVANNHIIIANNEDFLKELIQEVQVATSLEDAGDYKAVQSALGKLSRTGKVSVREFGRIDQMVEVNYEMLRQQKMANSETSLARTLNRIFKTANPQDEARQQKIDGSTLPADYSRVVAPYLGPSGWIVEKTDSGWLMSGCILKKKVNGELVERNDDQTAEKRR